MAKNAHYWIRHLALEPHPEGGYYRQTYKAGLVLPKQGLPEQFRGERPASTAIYFLLERDDFSAFHRLQSDEVWHFYAGAPVVVHVIAPDGGYSKIRLGGDPESGEMFQAVVKAGCWFASHLEGAVVDPVDVGSGGVGVVWDPTPSAPLRAGSKVGKSATLGWGTPSRISDELRREDSYALVGCTVAPGFEFEDFELGRREELWNRYPEHRRLIDRLTRR